MDRAITDFHRDDRDDWVAQLSCGHNQHVRHRPPFQLRPWVVEEAGRSARLGTTLDCPDCDRAELPGALRFLRRSPAWTESTMPPGLRRRHRLAAGTWGKIVLQKGRLHIVLETVPRHDLDLSGPGCRQAIPPEVDHEVEPRGAATFTLDVFAVDRQEI